ncbi:MAG: protein kinase [Deltaproteobacteria bacterium]|nr:protein kinase [Deltaproteobacteria bacterium]
MEQQIIPQGTVVGNRFAIEDLAGQGDLGYVYKARDTKANQIVALRVIPRALIPDESDVDRLRVRVKESSTLTHKNIRVTFGMGVDNDGSIFIAMEWIDGQNLASLLAKRAEDGKRFSFKGAYNIMGHVCNGLTYAHHKLFHGALSSHAIMINNAGRVKVSDWGLSLIRAGLPTYAGRQKLESVFWSPEVMKNIENGSPRSDIYSLGALFYQLITGVPPARPLKAPSLLGFPKDVDAVIARCMAANPTQRFADAAAVKQAVAALVRTHEADAKAAEIDDGLSIDVEIDMADMGVKEPGTSFKEPVPTFSMSQTATTQPKPHTGSMLAAPGLPPPPSANLGTVANSASDLMPGRASVIDMGQVMSSLSKSEAARWMVQKKKFDHGPFTDRELIQMILRGEAEANDQLLNMDTGVRKKLRAWGDFDEYLERYRIKKKEEEERLALERTEKAEKRGTFFFVMVALGVLGVVGLAVGGWLISRQVRKEKVYTPESIVAALDSGEIKLKTGGSLINKARAGGAGGGHRRGGRGGAGGGEFVPGMSYEEAMNTAVDLGSAQDNAGQKALTPEIIGHIMDQNVRRFLPCMAGQHEKRVDMNIAIAGDGGIIGVSVTQGDGSLHSCVQRVVRSIRFPASGAPRTAASWYFELY